MYLDSAGPLKECNALPGYAYDHRTRVTICNYCSFSQFSLHLCPTTMLPELYGVKTDDCTLGCDTNTMTQSSSCSRTAAIMNNTELLSGHQT